MNKLVRQMLFVILLLSIVVSACAPATTPAVVVPTTEPTVAPAASTDTPAAPASKFSQSPMLDAKVADGTLPPVDQRLPENPRIIDAAGATVGTYGGDFRDPFVGDSYWAAQMIFMIAWHGLVVGTKPTTVGLLISQKKSMSAVTQLPTLSTCARVSSGPMVNPSPPMMCCFILTTSWPILNSAAAKSRTAF